MKEYKNHIDFESDFFKSTSIQYSKSKEEIWADMESTLDSVPKSRVIRVDFRKVIKYSAAAILVISLGLYSFLRFYIC